MVRSIWKKTLVASLAWASFGWAGQPATPANLALPEPVPATSPERTLTVQETGKAGQKCKVMKTWQTPEGATAYQVQGLETGEIMTIVESGPITSTAGSQPGTRLNAVATRIFHWTSSNTPPAEAPLPPGEAVQKVSATPVPAEPAPSWTRPQGTCEPREGILSRLRSRTRGHEGISSSDPCAPCPPCERQAAQVVQPCERQPAQVVGPCERQPAHVASQTSPYSPVPSEPCCEPVNAQNDQVVPVLPALRLSKEAAAAMEPKFPDTKDTNTFPQDCCSDANDLRKSWGKADDHKVTPKSDKPQADEAKQPAAKPVLPAVDCTKLDPLHPPEPCLPSFVHEESAKKSDVVKTDDRQKKKADRDKDLYDWSAGRAADKSPRPPLGAQSVVGAGNGMGGQVQFVPVPIVTVPDLTHPPMPPLRAPQPFMQQNGALANANVPPPSNKAFGPNVTTTDEGMVNAFTSLPSREAVALATNAFSNGEASGAGSQGAVMPAAAPAMSTPNTYGAMAQAAPATARMAPMTQAVMPAGYEVAMPTNPMAGITGPEAQMLAALHDSIYPSQREWAAEGLATIDWRIHPEAAQALMMAATQDPAATVRTACVRHLARMKVNTVPVIQAVQALRTDPDPRVRQEAEQALMVLQPSQSRTSWNRGN